MLCPSRRTLLSRKMETSDRTHIRKGESPRRHAEWESETRTVHAEGFHLCEAPEQVKLTYSNWKNGAFILSLVARQQFACQCRRHGFSPYVRNIPWRRKWQPNPVYLRRKPHRQRSLEGLQRPRGLSNGTATTWKQVSGCLQLECKGQKGTLLGWQKCSTSWLWWWLQQYIICPNSLNNF